MIREVLGLYETSHAAVEIDLASDLPPVSGDPTQLRGEPAFVFAVAAQVQQAVFQHQRRGACDFFRRIGRDERTDVDLEPGNRPGFDD